MINDLDCSIVQSHRVLELFSHAEKERIVILPDSDRGSIGGEKSPDPRER